MADLTNPPVGGRTYTTSQAVTDGHVHQITLSSAQLVAIAAHQTIVVTTTVVESHTHDFSLQETATPAAPAPAPTPAPTTAPAPTTTGPY
jgi:hypothetical protein